MNKTQIKLVKRLLKVYDDSLKYKDFFAGKSTLDIHTNLKGKRDVKQGEKLVEKYPKVFFCDDICHWHLDRLVLLSPSKAQLLLKDYEASK